MKKLLLILSLVFIAWACEKIRSYPDEPEISHKSHKLSYATDVLGNKVYLLEFEFNYVDGDGDLTSPLSPIRSSDTTDTTTYSTFAYQILFKDKGIYKPYIAPEDSSPVIYAYLPWEEFMSRDGQNKTFKGSIIKRIEFYQPYPYDTFKVEYFVTDFAYHKSNVVEIPEELILK
ncbi:MAG TPA: hypothetical protein VHO72_11990 [Bacteroidales bacterium]|nr:hypothetical protein [Bacteroidales bacterium]